MGTYRTYLSSPKKDDIDLDRLYTIASGVNESTIFDGLNEDEALFVGRIREALFEDYVYPLEEALPDFRTPKNIPGTNLPGFNVKGGAPMPQRTPAAPVVAPVAGKPALVTKKPAGGLPPFAPPKPPPAPVIAKVRADNYNQIVKQYLGNNAKPTMIHNITTGRFYYFQYTSKMYAKKQIDFYEKNPIIYSIVMQPKVILGLNLHYLSPADRITVVDKLKGMYTAKWNNDHKLGLDWQVAKVILGLDAKKMLHAYLPQRIKNCYRVTPNGIYIFSRLDTSKFTPEVTKQMVWDNDPSIDGNKLV